MMRCIHGYRTGGILKNCVTWKVCGILVGNNSISGETLTSNTEHIFGSGDRQAAVRELFQQPMRLAIQYTFLARKWFRRFSISWQESSKAGKRVH